MIDPSEVSRAVRTLWIEPIPAEDCGSRLAIADVFRIAIHVKRAALEDVGGILDWAECAHSDQVESIRAEIDAIFAALPDRKPAIEMHPRLANKSQ